MCIYVNTLLLLWNYLYFTTTYTYQGKYTVSSVTKSLFKLNEYCKAVISQKINTILKTHLQELDPHGFINL